MTTLFISDLHLQTSRPDLTRLFLQFLKNHAGKVDALYILGDLFEAWIGDDDNTPFNQSIITALRTFAESGSRLYFLPGNRDFLIGKDFSKKTGCTLLLDPTLIDLYGEQVLLLHGDSLCTLDKKHMLFRKFTHSYLLQKIALWIPLRWRRALAEKLRAYSKTHTQLMAPSIMDTTPDAIKSLLQHYPATTLIHGHTHRPSIEYFRHNNALICRIVLSDWEKHAHALVCDKTSKQLITFTYETRQDTP